MAAVARLPAFFLEWRRYRRLSNESSVALRDLYPCLTDRTESTPFDPHYFFQSAWLARKLACRHVPLHVDAGSSVTMLAVMSAHVPTVFLDYRPLAVSLPDMFPVAGTLSSLPFADQSLASVSSLHVVEHVGLGRYGDPLNARGSRDAMSELVRVVAPGGRLYLSVPVGRERVCFNAQRIFAGRTVIEWAQPLRLLEFALVDDAGAFHPATDLSRAEGLAYGCGLFEFERSND